MLRKYFHNFKKLQGSGGWMGEVGVDLDHNITQNIHIKTFLMRGQKVF